MEGSRDVLSFRVRGKKKKKEANSQATLCHKTRQPPSRRCCFLNVFIGASNLWAAAPIQFLSVPKLPRSWTRSFGNSSFVSQGEEFSLRGAESTRSITELCHGPDPVPLELHGGKNLGKNPPYPEQELSQGGWKWKMILFKRGCPFFEPSNKPSMFPEKGWVVTANTGTACGRGGKKEVDVSCDPNSSSKSSAARRDIPERVAPKTVPWGDLSEKCLPAEGSSPLLPGHYFTAALIN